MILVPPIEPMLAKPLGHTLPSGEGVAFEPKWDGFRCLVFRRADDVVLQGRGRSRDGELVDLAYAFPELVETVLAQVPAGTVLDGEIVAERSGRLDFGTLSSRLRPRSEAGGPNIARLARTAPASLLLFDVLENDGVTFLGEPYQERHARLASLAAPWSPPLRLTPNTTDPAVALSWFTGFESAGVDGLIVKPLADPYRPGVRAQGKVKHQRTADVVLAGWRPHVRPGPDGGPMVGSLLLGLYDEAGRLHHVGAASAFSAARRAELAVELEPLTAADAAPHPWRDADPATVSVPGEASRWKKEQPWIALRPEHVLEVTYEQMEGPRFRHLAGFLRWRPDRDPASCRFDQLEVPPASDIADLLAGS